MIPTRTLFKVITTWGTASGTSNFANVKAAFQDAGATEITDTEDANGGFTCKLGRVPMHVFVNTSSSTRYQIAFKFGENDEYQLCGDQYLSVGGIVVFKGDTGVALAIVGYNTMAGNNLTICLDKTTGRVYTTSYQNTTGYLNAYDFVDGEITREQRTLTTGSGSVIEDSSINYTDTAILIKQAWFGEMAVTAPQTYKASLLTNCPEWLEVIQIDSAYFLSMWRYSFYQSSGGQISSTKKTYGCVLFPLSVQLIPDGPEDDIG